ncbi:S-methyl-5'-thioadenosine phosphorylase-like [Tubulanus polymorphus]|uniref:S-methyl-5'-thioadenosine phosphorylase-like n=1 Tax=Tubulanus polymorphus TaxID=672921 RepID=UPI003DA53A02
MMTGVKIGIIGGTGLDDPSVLESRQELTVSTPFGNPSDVLITGTISGVQCVLLARHGRKHSVLPTDVNYRANIWALKQQGCTHLLVTTACGSLQKEMVPKDIVVLDQFIDRTTKRQQTFYDGKPGSPAGILHIPMAEPFCPQTRAILSKSADELGVKTHPSGTMVTIEGPRFSSKAESKLFHSWGADCINMTTVPEVVLAQEAGIRYGALGLVTDYDSWMDDIPHVDVQSVLTVVKTNAKHGLDIIKNAIPKIAAEDWSETIQQHSDMVKCSTMLPH